MKLSNKQHITKDGIVKRNPPINSFKLSVLSGDINWRDYGSKWITKKLNNGDWDYYLIIELVNMEDASGDISDGKYAVMIHAIKPDHSPKQMKEVYDVSGITEEDVKNNYNTKGMLSAISDYGLQATLWSKMGNNADALLKEAKAQLPIINGLFGFYMDRRLNAMGDTGWDFIEGNVGKRFK